MNTSETCSSCGTKLIGHGNTSFPCPSCGKTLTGRCIHCRDQSVIYRCKECGFTGP
ncbi:MAG: zinc finger domain-containing protein [Candidatus Thermoplasmatota archaeon]